MPVLKHPLTGGVYDLQENGLIKVSEKGKQGLFHPDGRYESGTLKHADMHLLGWLGGPQTTPVDNRHASGHVQDDSE